MNGVDITKHKYTIKVVRMVEEYYSIEGADVREVIEKFNPDDVPAARETGWLEMVEIVKQYSPEGI